MEIGMSILKTSFNPFIQVNKSSPYGVTSLCALFGASKQAFYKHEDSYFNDLAQESIIIEFFNKNNNNIRN